MTPAEIRALRNKLGWTAARLANEVGATERTVWRWLNGESAPLPIYLKKLNELACRAGKGTP